MKRLPWVPTTPTLAGSVAIAFPIMYFKKEKNSISISSQIPESALGVFRHVKLC